jgi:hypothetical protein
MMSDIRHLQRHYLLLETRHLRLVIVNFQDSFCRGHHLYSFVCLTQRCNSISLRVTQTSANVLPKMYSGGDGEAVADAKTAPYNLPVNQRSSNSERWET